jgi:hypothetical protein
MLGDTVVGIFDFDYKRRVPAAAFFTVGIRTTLFFNQQVYGCQLAVAKVIVKNQTGTKGKVEDRQKQG